MTDKSNSQVPIRSITISVGKGARDMFFEQLKKFADKHAFAIRIAPVRPEHFIVQMWREDIKAIGDNPFDTLVFAAEVQGSQRTQEEDQPDLRAD